MKTTIVFALVCISMSLGAVFLQLPNPKAGKGKCISSFPNLGELSYGESKSVPGECLSVTCNKDGGISGVTCISIGISDPNCKVDDGDSSKPYPECCPQIKCE